MHFPKTQRCCTADVKKVRTHIKFYICNYCYFIVRQKTSANYYIFESNIIYQLWRVQVKISVPLLGFFLILSLPMYYGVFISCFSDIYGNQYGANCIPLLCHTGRLLQFSNSLIFTLSRSTTKHYFV